MQANKRIGCLSNQRKRTSNINYYKGQALLLFLSGFRQEKANYFFLKKRILISVRLQFFLFIHFLLVNSTGYLGLFSFRVLFSWANNQKKKFFDLGIFGKGKNRWLKQPKIDDRKKGREKNKIDERTRRIMLINFDVRWMLMFALEKKTIPFK